MENGSKPETIYFAAGLFSGRELLFNLSLTRALERHGYRVFLPQRDGFEFSHLHNHLADLIPERDVSEAVQTIIYLLDMGIYLPASDVVVANLDEPLDEGVVVEISYARMMNKFVVGLRTDTRSPFGGPQEELGGMHFFPAFQCDVFIRRTMNASTRKRIFQELLLLASDTNDAIATKLVLQQPAAGLASPQLEKLTRAARLLFGNPPYENLKTNDGMKRVARNWHMHVDEISSIRPRLYRIGKA